MGSPTSVKQSLRETTRISLRLANRLLYGAQLFCVGRVRGGSEERERRPKVWREVTRPKENLGLVRGRSVRRDCGETKSENRLRTESDRGPSEQHLRCLPELPEARA
jgi:hypothetical protein